MNEQHPTDVALHSFFVNPDQGQVSSAIREHLRSCEPCRRRARTIKSAVVSASASAGRTVVESAEVPPSRQAAPRSSEYAPPQLPDYEFIKRLGGGGMGVLYLYRHVIMDRLVAIKVVAGHLTENPQVLARFLDEIRAVCKIDDRNVVKALTASRWENGLIFVMEYVDGMDLASVLSKRGPLPVTEACFYIYQAARGLKAAHALGIYHRDIKPDNLMLDLSSGKKLVKILDFGLAKAASEGPVATSRTTDGSMLGTVDYMAPEQIRKASEADHRADIYSLGCTFYHLLSGRPPFHGESLYDILQAHHSTEASPLNLLRSDVPPQLAALVAKMMEKDRDRRFQSASEVLEALRPFCEAGSSSAQIPVVSPPAAKPADSSARQKTMVEQSLGSELSPRRSLGERTPNPASSGRSTRQRTMLETGLDLDHSAQVAVPGRRGTMVETGPIVPAAAGSLASEEPDLDSPEEPEGMPIWKIAAIAGSLGALVLVLVVVALRPAQDSPAKLVAGSIGVPSRPANPGNDDFSVREPSSRESPEVRPVDLGRDSEAPPAGNPTSLAGEPDARAQVPGAENPFHGVDVQPVTEDREPKNGGSANPNPDATLVAASTVRDSQKADVIPQDLEPPPRKATPDPDGIVREDYSVVAGNPGFYEDLRVKPPGHLRIGTKFEMGKYAEGYGVIVIATSDGLTITQESGRSPQGLTLVLDPGVADAMTQCGFEEQLTPALRAVPTFIVRRLLFNDGERWAGVIVSLEVLVLEDAMKVVANDYEEGLQVLSLENGRLSRVTSRGAEWFERLGGEKERSKLQMRIKRYQDRMRTKAGMRNAQRTMQTLLNDTVRMQNSQQLQQLRFKQNTLLPR